MNLEDCLQELEEITGTSVPDDIEAGIRALKPGDSYLMFVETMWGSIRPLIVTRPADPAENMKSGFGPREILT